MLYLDGIVSVNFERMIPQKCKSDTIAQKAIASRNTTKSDTIAQKAIASRNYSYYFSEKIAMRFLRPPLLTRIIGNGIYDIKQHVTLMKDTLIQRD